MEWNKPELAWMYNRTFIATAPRIIRPTTVYKVNVVLLPSSTDLILKAVIIKGSGQQIASAVQNADAGASHDLLLKVGWKLIHILPDTYFIIFIARRFRPPLTKAIIDSN